MKSVYASKCAVCHGNDGSANTAKGKELKVRNLRSEEFKKMSDAKAMEVLLKGKGKMEGYEKTLGKEKLEQLLAYCRELSNKQYLINNHRSRQPVRVSSATKLPLTLSRCQRRLSEKIQ